jgi:phage host-nuclease inhibitor protein Gam
MTTLSENRNVTLADATGMMEKLCHAACRLAVVKARKAKRMAEIESEYQDKMLEDMAEADLLTLRLREFCRANPHLFVKPRKVKTPFGEFGLQQVSDLCIDDMTALMQTLLDRGYEDCLKTERKPIKDAIRARLDAGEIIPGATVRTAENDPVVKVSPKLLKDAIEKV